MKRRLTFACVAVSTTLLIAAGTSEVVEPANEPVIIADTEFLDSDWTVTGAFNNGARETHERRTTGGNPGAYRHMEHTVPGTASLSVTHEYVAASYDPSTAGAISGVDYTVDRIDIDPPFVGAAIGARFAVFQDGVRYLANAVTTFTNTEWQIHTLKCLTPQDFTPVNDRLPDFSASGSPLTFGFVRSNTNNNPSGSLVLQNGADNFRVVVYPESNSDCAGGPADIRVTKTDGDRRWAFDPVVPYTIDVTNVGGQSSPVTIEEIVPVNTRFRAELSTPGWVCENDQGGSSCTLDVGDLAAGESASVDFVVEVINGIPVGFGLFNEAIVDAGGSIVAVDTTSEGPCDPANPVSEVLCGILCVMFPVTCTDDTPGSSVFKGLLSRVTDALSETFDDVLLYRIRDRFMVDTRGGRRATELFYEFSTDLSRAALDEPSVIGLGREALGAWEQNLNLLAAGRGGSAVVSQTQIDAIDDFLDAVRPVAGEALRTALDRERARLGLSDWPGINMVQALARLDRLTCSGYETLLFCGELNGDCAVTATDALLALNISVGLLPPQDEADMDASGSVTVQDALRILRQGVGIDPPTSACNG
jgi:hypothetical protein